VREDENLLDEGRSEIHNTKMDSLPNPLPPHHIQHIHLIHDRGQRLGYMLHYSDLILPVDGG